MNDMKGCVKEAIEKGNLSELDRLLKDSPEWDIRSEHLELSHYTGSGGKQTALHLACTHGHLNIVEYLVLGRGCSVTQTNLGGLTPLELAWSYKHWEVVLCLLNYIQEKGVLQGKSPSQSVFRSLSVEAIIPQFQALAPFEKDSFRAACKQNLLQTLQCLCKMKRNSPGLHISWRVACANRDLPTMQFIINYGNFMDHEIPDLHKACLLGDETMAIKMINESQSGINSLVEIDKYGMTPVHYASCEPHLLRLLVRVGEQMCDDIGINMEQFRDTAMGNTPLHYAVMCGCLESLDVLASLCGSLIINIKNNKGCTPLHLSVKQLNMLVALLKYQQCSINETDDNGETALHMACRGWNVECVRALIQNEKCDPNIQLSDGSTALHVVVGSTYTVYQQEIVQVLMESDNIDPNINDNTDQTPFHCAIASGKLNIVEALISSGKCRQEHNVHTFMDSTKPQLLSALLKYLDNDCSINEKGDNGETALHKACRDEKLECVCALIGDERCDPNIQLSDGSTALHVAVSSDHTVYQQPIVQCLLKSANIDPNLKDISGQTPLHIAVVRKHFETASLLLKLSTHKPNLQDNDGNTALHLGVGSLYAVELFLSHTSIDLNIQNSAGNTPLHEAVIREASCNVVKALVLHKSCDPNIVNMTGMTPLQCAIASGQLDYVEILISSGKCSHEHKTICGTHRDVDSNKLQLFSALFQCPDLSINKKDHNGETALHKACRSGKLEYIRALIGDERCDSNIQLSDGSTALHIAVSSDYHTVYQHEAVVQCILQSTKVDPNFKDNSGQTPLHIAVVRKHLEIIFVVKSFLCHASIDLNIQNSAGNTPLHEAVIEGASCDVVKVLVLHKSYDPNIVNKAGMTPLQCAITSGELDYVEVLISSDKYSLEHNSIIVKSISHNLLLRRVVDSKKAQLLSALLKFQGCSINDKDSDGETALHKACRSGNLECFLALIKDGRCDPNIQLGDGSTALHIAVSSDYTVYKQEIVECLLENTKIDPNVKNNSGQTPLHISVVRRHFETVFLLLKHSKHKPNLQDNDGNTALHLGVESLFVVRLFLSHASIHINIQNSAGNTPLHEAVIRGASCNVVKALVHHKDCDVLIRDKKGKTQLQLTMFHVSRLDIMEALLASDKLGLQDTVEGLREKMWVFSKGLLHNYPILVKKCIDVGCSVNNANAIRETPLHIVCREGHKESCLLLLQCKEIDILAQDVFGNAPIHIVCLYLKEKCLEVLLDHEMCDPNQTNHKGDTPLHILCSSQQPSENMIRMLISHPGINLKCINYFDQTPLDCVPQSNTSIITMISKCLRLKQIKLETYLKIFVLGNSGNGKSTLIKAITTEASQLLKFTARRVNPSDVPPHTAGIVPIPFNSKHFGHAVLYDFAGQHEYYSSHAAVIENLILPSPPLFLLLIDISKPMEKIKEELMYWWLYIDNHCQRAIRIPHAILVGSHKDIARLNGEDPHRKMKDITQSIMSKEVSFTLEGYFLLDCRKLASKGLTGLLNQLRTTCQTLRETADIDLCCNILKAFCVENFDDETIACTFSDVIGSEHFILPQNPSRLISLLSTLSDKGHILLLHNHTDVNKSWVILKPDVLLTEVNGSIFAPENFKEHNSHGFSMSTGVIALTNIKEKFSSVNHQVITGYLTHMEYCFQIKDQHSLELITNDPALKVHSKEEEVYYFFPGLVQTENPKDVYQPQDGITYFKCGWLCKCCNESEQLTTRFLHVLILRLTFAFSCETPDDTTEKESVVLLRSCSVWKHGIAWWTNDGIETVVEVGLQCRWVAVMMRCPDTHKVQCAELRSKVITTILKTKKDFCPAITMNEFLIAPSCLRYPFQGRELTLYSMREIAIVVIDGMDFPRDTEGKNPLRVSLLLPFEPYFSMGSVTDEFFSTDQSTRSRELSREDLLRVSEFCCKNLESFEIALKPSLTAYEDECSRAGDSRVRRCAGLFQILQRRGCKTWRDFEREFSRFSIFCGRNPMVTTTTLCS